MGINSKKVFHKLYKKIREGYSIRLKRVWLIWDIELFLHTSSEILKLKYKITGKITGLHSNSFSHI